MAVVSKEMCWHKLGYNPHPGQRIIHDAVERIRVCSCGRRFGKSIIGGKELIPEAVLTYSIRNQLEELGKKRRFWIVGPDYTDVDKEFRVLWDDIKRLQLPLDKPGSYYAPQGGNYRLSLWDGLFIVEGKSAKVPDSLDGEGLSGVELVEAAKLKPHIWSKYIRPSLADERGWALMTSTPEGKNWFYRAWQTGQDPGRPQWRSWRMPSWLNPFVYPGGRDDEEILDMRADMSEERFNQEIAADFTEFVGRVFKDFDEEIHVGDFPYNPQLPLYGATDYGWSNPFVWLAIQVDTFQNVYVIGEYRVTHRDINDISRDLQAWPLAMNASTLYPEPAGPDESAVLEKALHVKLAGSTGGELNWRLNLIRQQLKMDPVSEGHPEELRQPKLFIDRRCIGNPLGDGGIIREMQEYRYPDTKEESLRAQPENPISKDDHGPEALGRFMRGYFGGPGEEAAQGRARIRKAVVMSG